ncbi:PP2C family protein-serine/threonine phosphatase [Micromonospora endolithica]|uniref:Serine/threonine-protein phosphatase n=1 Tax=Micromonospora endolithica TaxID=230091 RepID=A0A3A9YYU2_9ACTN|nr:PP2C family protein-serine/threonine phosphatase [Micromonospora endolithica]RKN41085.1 serine/threonine-protein phosphatase [Micromonospora endolithica]TWJ24310.1 serine phosphatase RsbU (regulator of sigma subunit) [Micromonospora endolithica]
MVDAGDAVRWLQLTAPRGGPDDLSQLVARAAPAIGASEIVIYLADYAQSDLVPLLDAGLVRDRLSIETTLAGRAFTSLELQCAADDPDRIWIPLLVGCERIGVLEVVSPAAEDPTLEGAARELAVHVAHLLANRRAYGDVVERLRRRLPMQVAAEIVWGLLPPLTFATDDLVITAILEPCYDVGGDVFDYALNGDVLSVGLFDTCGHGIRASSLASLVVSAYRNARRCGLDLVDTAISIDRWVRSEHPNMFATALLAELDRRTGRLHMINAGHPGALLLRDGKAIRELPGPTALPLGLGHLTSRRPRVHEENLHPGDRLLAYTDGITDARNEDREQFGVDRLVDFVNRALNDRLPSPETMRRLVRAVVAYQDDELDDDATAMFLEWRPPHTPLAHLGDLAATGP